ncbi:vegetative cell wall protein gp1-like [Gastrolobium bilobum]|uniref:vegetative cell wall protein gp1-like n=1 Tax=Gastrolobium bilobum TaxID=150636 RepID=UPI002AAF9AB9|nr:vegetative cell wall protein gp1-like [Gastrolobium bilobum]
MTHLCKLLITLLALIATVLPSPTQASPIDSYHEPAPAPASPPEINNDDDPLSPLSHSPSPSYPSDDEEDMAPEYQYPSPPSYAPGIEEDYPYAENPFPSPSEAPYFDDIMAPEPDADDEFYYSPYEAPSPTESTYSAGVSYDAADIAPATPPVVPFSYSAEDDSGGFSDEEEYPELKKENRSVIGFVMGAICLVGLGGLVYKKKKKNQKRDHPMYVQLSKKMDV